MSAQLPPAAELIARAIHDTGIAIDDVDAREPLTRLVDSLNAEGELHPSGARLMTDRLVRLLANRLRLARDLAAHPEIAEQPINRPLFICGMPRTGSTKTQKLLAATGDFNWLPYWQALNPALITGERGEDPAARIADTDAFVAAFDAASPEARHGHQFATHEPEEESFLLEHSLMSPCLMGWAPIPSYLGWLIGADLSRQFAMLRLLLQYLEWQGLADPGKRWVLKSPLYTSLEPLLLETFPDADLVVTHRDPLASIPSGLKLLGAFHKPFTDAAPDPASYSAGMAAAAAQHLAWRASAPDRVLDVGFDRIVTDPVGVVRAIYRHADLELSAAAAARVAHWDAEHPPHRAGRHLYSLDQLGLDGAAIEHDFAEYRQLSMSSEQLA